MNKFSIVQTDISYEKCETHTDFGNMESIVLYTKDFLNYLYDNSYQYLHA